ncbi:hypothetical protein J2X65_003154 [Ancylobacter sp. 3268]|uniref:hypothetical protein n=1 Tax=Ancylobacter sp. 3268 TaxID=2817752 RepID=UPI00285E7A8A|nr:hypothetical protein [Ancylobacter sp. 3268]MDR6953791.1 hypothetical protein [Ancylobacter sp. 3268]
MPRIGIVRKPFPFAPDGVTVEQLSAGQTLNFPDTVFNGLRDAGYIEAAPEDDGGQSALNARIVAAFDQRLAATSDEELKSIIARSGTPWTGNLVHAAMVGAAKEQLVREMEGATPILGIDPNAGLTEQSPSVPATPTPPSAPAAVGGATTSTVEMKAVHAGRGSYSVMQGEDVLDLGEKLTKAEADAFNAMDVAGKAAFIAGRKG